MYCIYVPTTHVIMSEKCFLKQEFYKLYVILLLALLARIFEVGFFTAANKKGRISKDFKQGQTFGKKSVLSSQRAACMYVIQYQKATYCSCNKTLISGKNYFVIPFPLSRCHYDFTLLSSND